MALLWGARKFDTCKKIPVIKYLVLRDYICLPPPDELSLIFNLCVGLIVRVAFLLMF